MAPDDHVNHGGGQPTPQLDDDTPAPLLKNATATIYLDGLIYAAYNENRKVLETAVLTAAEGHEVVVRVSMRGDDTLRFPTPEKPWSPKHTDVSAAAPFWLYVDSGNGLAKDEFSADLHRGDCNRSFDSLFNFEGQHDKPLKLKQGNFAVFNFPHGTSYSAETKPAELMRIPAGKKLADAEPEREINVSNLAGIDIDAVSNGAGKKSIVLANQDGANEVFRFDLEPGKQYKIEILNQPEEGSHEHDLDPEKHFLLYYKLFDLDHSENPQFVLVDPEHAHESEETSESEELGDPPSPDNPPCAPGRSGGLGGLGTGG
jgi:hypothetical protein